jgi:hypothetical protein
MKKAKVLWTGRGHIYSPIDSKLGKVMKWADTDNRSWEIQFHSAIRQGRKQAVGFHITASRKNDKPLTAELMRSIPFATMFIEELQRRSSKDVELGSPPKYTGSKQGVALDDTVLQFVATLYRHALDTGQSPPQYIAKQMGISKSAATKRIQRARQHSHLGKAKPGKPGEME